MTSRNKRLARRTRFESDLKSMLSVLSRGDDMGRKHENNGNRIGMTLSGRQTDNSAPVGDKPAANGSKSATTGDKPVPPQAKNGQRVYHAGVSKPRRSQLGRL